MGANVPAFVCLFPLQSAEGWGIFILVASDGKVKWLFFRILMEVNFLFTSSLKGQISFCVYIPAYILAHMQEMS